MSAFANTIRRAAAATTLTALAAGGALLAASPAGATPLQNSASFTVPAADRPWAMTFVGSFPTGDATARGSYTNAAYSLRATCADGRTWTTPATVHNDLNPTVPGATVEWLMTSDDVSAGQAFALEAGLRCTIAPVFPPNRTAGLQLNRDWYLNPTSFAPHTSVPGMFSDYRADVVVVTPMGYGGL